MANLHAPAQTCLVAGDTVYDIEMGQRADADTCGVTCGNNSADELHRLDPTFLIDSFFQLLSCPE